MSFHGSRLSVRSRGSQKEERDDNYYLDVLNAHLREAYENEPVSSDKPGTHINPTIISNNCSATSEVITALAGPSSLVAPRIVNILGEKMHPITVLEYDGQQDGFRQDKFERDSLMATMAFEHYDCEAGIWMKQGDSQISIPDESEDFLLGDAYAWRDPDDSLWMLDQSGVLRSQGMINEMKYIEPGRADGGMSASLSAEPSAYLFTTPPTRRKRSSLSLISPTLLMRPQAEPKRLRSSSNTFGLGSPDSLPNFVPMPLASIMEHHSSITELDDDELPDNPPSPRSHKVHPIIPPSPTSFITTTIREKPVSPASQPDPIISTPDGLSLHSPSSMSQEDPKSSPLSAISTFSAQNSPQQFTDPAMRRVLYQLLHPPADAFRLGSNRLNKNWLVAAFPNHFTPLGTVKNGTVLQRYLIKRLWIGGIGDIIMTSDEHYEPIATTPIEDDNLNGKHLLPSPFLVSPTAASMVGAHDTVSLASPLLPSFSPNEYRITQATHPDPGHVKAYISFLLGLESDDKAPTRDDVFQPGYFDEWEGDREDCWRWCVRRRRVVDDDCVWRDCGLFLEEDGDGF